jgi:hypothetical protein
MHLTGHGAEGFQNPPVFRERPVENNKNAHSIKRLFPFTEIPEKRRISLFSFKKMQGKHTKTRVRSVFLLIESKQQGRNTDATDN